LSSNVFLDVFFCLSSRLGERNSLLPFGHFRGLRRSFYAEYFENNFEQGDISGIIKGFRIFAKLFCHVFISKNSFVFPPFSCNSIVNFLHILNRGKKGYNKIVRVSESKQELILVEKKKP